MLLKETFEARGIHESWESVYRDNPLQDRFNTAILDRILNVVRPAPGALFLDAGCGVGYHTLALASRGFRCTGVDISSSVLEQAASNRARCGLGQRVTFACESLEDLPFADGAFDAVHCRGVLMHVPQWQRALRQLCRVLRPGGAFIVLESNTRAVETWVVRALRQFRRVRSEMRATPGGLEFWAQTDGNAVVTRIANLAVLEQEMRAGAVEPITRFASECWDLNRFRVGWRRNLAIRANRLWFTARLPAWMSMGNVVIGRKQGCRQSGK